MQSQWKMKMTAECKRLIKVDAEDAHFLELNWHVNSGGYVVRNLRLDSVTRITLGLHRAILGLGYGDKRQVDHINGDLLDNRRSNLRICIKADNAKNRKLNKNNPLRIKGVTMEGKSYKAQIQSDGRKVYLGCFTSLAKAEAAYLSVAERLHGQFRRDEPNTT